MTTRALPPLLSSDGQLLPLEGIRVVEIAQNLAGPIAAEILAHTGADVVKVERPEGDDARRWGRIVSDHLRRAGGGAVP